MKTLIVLVTLISGQAFANSFAVTSNVVGGLTFLTSGVYCKEARETINDTQEYIVSGVLSLSLEQKINDMKVENPSLSTEEILDLLVINAEETLLTAQP